jgi:flagellar biosynthetic protein FliR
LPLSLEPLLTHVPAWLLVLFRLTGVFLFAPVFGSAVIPARVKVFLALGLSFCVYPALLEPGHPSARLVKPVVESGLSLWGVAGAVAVELLIGMVIGYGASMALFGVQIAGHVMDQQLGLGLAGVINPEFNEQSGIVSEVYYTLAVALFLIVGGHRVVLGALIGSFQRIPLGGFQVDGAVADLVLGLFATMLDVALRISGPLLCLVLLETVALGFIARTVPQINILSVGFSLRILIGMSLLIGGLGITAEVFTTELEQALGRLVDFFAGWKALPAG